MESQYFLTNFISCKSIAISKKYFNHILGIIIFYHINHFCNILFQFVEYQDT